MVLKLFSRCLERVSIGAAVDEKRSLVRRLLPQGDKLDGYTSK